MNPDEGTTAMNNRNYLLKVLLCGSLVIGLNASAQNKDVDQSDTLDFQSFHKDKKEAIKVWDKGSTTTKAYQDQPAASTTTAPAPTAATPVAPTTTTPVAADEPKTKSLVSTVAGEPSKRFEIRERYTLTRSTKTPYSAFYVIEPLYKQAAQLCPKGWKKLSEKSEPIEQDFYLYYEIECL
jgi:hypothetical protein